MEKKYIGFLILLILAVSFAIILPGQVRIDVQNTKTIYKVYEGGPWILAATEYVNLFDGTTKMRASSRQLSQTEDSGIIKIERIANYKDGISTKETYVFDSTKADVVLVPILHETICINCVGKILQFEFRNILYDGETKDISSPFSFGHSMKLTWQDGAYRAKVYQQIITDKIIIRYRPTKDYQIFNTRLFDPPGAVNVNVTILFPVNNTLYRVFKLDLNWTTNASPANYSFYSINGGANNTAIFFGTTPTNITLILGEGNYNITIWTNNSDGEMGQSDLLNFSIIPPLNASLNPSLTDLGFVVNWSKVTGQLNFSNATVAAGNYTWNFTDKNLSTSTVDYTYEIINRRINNVTISLQISRINETYNLTYNKTEIGLSAVNIFNISANSSIKINLTIDLINISQTYRNWNITINRANWSFDINFTDWVLI